MSEREACKSSALADRYGEAKRQRRQRSAAVETDLGCSRNCHNGLAFANRSSPASKWESMLVPVREGPPQPTPPPKHGPSRLPVRQTDRMGIWTGVAVIAFVVLLAILFIAPGREEANKVPSQRVEKTTPPANSTPSPKP